jgi:hypothetical protein
MESSKGGIVTIGEGGINVTVIVDVNGIGNQIFQFGYFQGCIRRTACCLVLLQFQLEVQTQPVGQVRGSILAI